MIDLLKVNQFPRMVLFWPQVSSMPRWGGEEEATFKSSTLQDKVLKSVADNENKKYDDNNDILKYDHHIDKGIIQACNLIVVTKVWDYQSATNRRRC